MSSPSGRANEKTPLQDDQSYDTEDYSGSEPEQQPQPAPQPQRQRTRQRSRQQQQPSWAQPQQQSNQQVAQRKQRGGMNDIGLDSVGETAGGIVNGVTGTLGGIAGQATDNHQQGGKSKSDTLRLRLDLNLDIEITLKAKIHGDLELALLYVNTFFAVIFVGFPPCMPCPCTARILRRRSFPGARRSQDPFLIRYAT